MASSLSIPIAFFNYQTKTMHHDTVTINSTRGEVSEILNPLEERFPGSYVSLNNQLTQLQEDDVIEDVYRKGDVLSAIKMRHDISRDGVRWPDRPSGDVVVFMDKYKKPIFFEPKNIEKWKWNDMEFSPYIAVFRYGMTPASLEIFFNKKKLLSGDSTRVMTWMKLSGQKYHAPKVTCGIFRFLYMSLFREMTV